MAAAVHSDSVRNMLRSIAHQVRGVPVVESTKLKQSWLAPGLCADRLPDKAKLLARWNQRHRRYEPATSADACVRTMVRLDYLLADPTVQLVDPVLDPPRGRLSKWFKDWRKQWQLAEQCIVGTANSEDRVAGEVNSDGDAGNDPIAQASFEFAGDCVIEAGDLQKCKALPALFRRYSKQVRQAVEKRITDPAQYHIARLSKAGAYVACGREVAQAK